MRYLVLISLLISGSGGASEIRLFPGYVTKVSCEGRLLVSSVGNDSLVRLEALPKELGCAVLLKPLTTQGHTNLILETSAAVVHTTVEIRIGKPSSKDLNHHLKGER